MQPPKLLQYVKICSLYGAGFYYIPGTDTCLKVGGFVRAEMNFNAGNSFSVHTGDHSSRAYDFEQSRARFVASFDARSQTEYGTLRSYFNLGMQASNGGGGSGIDTYANRGFIQWAGFTAGLADSFFDFYVTPAYSNQTNWLASDVGGGGTLVFGYTAQFGNGMSATLAAEDTSDRRKAIIGDVYAGRQWPDIVGNLRIDQAWGSAQIMGALHQVRGFTRGDEVGWAAGAGLKVNLPWGHGDNVSMQAAYAKGALSYSMALTGRAGGVNVSENGTDFGYMNLDDAVNTGTSLELTESWSVVAGLMHHWNPEWNTSLYGGYGEVNFNGASAAALGLGSPDWNFGQIASRTAWTPVKNLTFSVDLIYNHVGSASNNQGTFEANASDVNWFAGMFRVQRNFWP
ncbi:MAG TPA: porin [Pseudolabrys sp.]|nr:porin [Pseudolabrys sp.]